MKKFKIELTERQLKLIWKALESYERIRMGQFTDIADDLAFANFVYDKERPGNAEEFDQRILRRNDADDMFAKAFRIAQPLREHKTEDMLIAEDMWMQIRERISPHEWREPLWNGDEPPMKIDEV